MAVNELEALSSLSITINEKDPSGPAEIHVTTKEIVNEDSEQPATNEVLPEPSPPKKTVAYLGDYIEACYYDSRFTYEKKVPIFNDGDGHYRPQLKQGRVNRILFYPGVFNPPHRSHQAMVNCAFAGCQDLNVIAAIVLPLGDIIMYREYTEYASFMGDERMRLWRGDNGPHDWLWVYGTWSGFWMEFRPKLIEAVEKDGFELEFVFLGGPDHIGKDHVTHIPWDCPNMVVSDIGRKADFVKEDGTLHDLAGYETWQTPDLPEGTRFKEAKDMPPWLIKSLADSMSVEKSDPEFLERLHREYTRRMNGTRTCMAGPDLEDMWVRFIPAGENPIRVSATDIRLIIGETETEGLLGALKDLAMNPEILVEMMEESRRPWSRPGPECLEEEKSAPTDKS
ncbi:hypothetical protein K445DRAFT_306687 [Daldinia sp. EC12]|nr:hypothetical protein K445DRAFT_306687 [Daldinia sp. EC12]